jgi:hypothetical protein
MDQPTLERSPEEVSEIAKHKYFLSEKAGHDVGWEFAEQDWESKFAEQFRQSCQTESPDSRGGAGGGISTFFVRVLAKARRR